MRTILQLKTDYASRPPFLFCVLAHYSEDVARAGAQRIIHALQDEPDESAHHRITIRFMPDVGFVADLRRFADGHSRLELQSETLQEIAKLAFIPIAEPTIEEKHARVAQDLKRHGLGQVRTSLSKRQPTSASWLRRPS